MFLMIPVILPLMAFAQQPGNPTHQPVNLTRVEKAWLAEHKNLRLAPDPDFIPVEWIDKKGQFQVYITTGICCGAILLLLGAIIAWNTALQRRVAQKTQELKNELSQRRRADMLSKQIQDKLFESEARFRGMFEHMHSGAAIYEAVQNGSEFIFKDFNPAAEKITRITKQEAVGQRLLDLFPHMDKSGLVAALRDVWQTGKYKHIEPFYYKDNIREGWRENRIYKLPSGEIVALFDDVTDRKKAEQELKKSKQKFQSMIDNIGIGVVLIGADMQLLEVNLQMREWFPQINEKKEMVCYHALKTPSQKGPCNNCPTQKTLQTGKPHEEIVTIYRGQTQFKFRIISSPVFDDNGKVASAIEVLEDITERERIVHYLQEAQKMESIGNLAGGIAHDFNNLLFPIIGMAELLVEDLPPGSPEHEKVREILKAGKRGSELVKQILVFSRQSEHKKRPVRIQQVLKEVLKLARSTIPSNIEITQTIEFDCGQVLADVTQIHQIVMNLITNAFHALEDSRGKIMVLLNEMTLDTSYPLPHALQPGKYAVLKISDTGCGISPQIREKIFDPYFTTKEKGKGTGLGLAVVYGIVKNHGGGIQVESIVDKGTTFTIYLPLIAGNVPEPDLLPQWDMPKGKERVLLVDDEAPVAHLEKLMLERLGYDVSFFTSSQESLDKLRTAPHAFDVIITDMTMPEMTGEQLAREALSIRPDIPIIICTGFSDKINKEVAETMDIKGFLLKPISMSKLARTVRTVLDEARASVN